MLLRASAPTPSAVTLPPRPALRRELASQRVQLTLVLGPNLPQWRPMQY